MAGACTRSNPAYYPPQGPPEQDVEDALRSVDAQRPPDAAIPADTSPAPTLAVDAPTLAADASAPPNIVFLTEPSPSPAVKPFAPGGRAFGDGCGDGRVLIGVIGTSGEPNVAGLNSVQARCAELALTGPPPALRTRNSATLGPHGTVADDRDDGTCPPDQVIVGFEAATGQWIDRMYVHCAPLTVRYECGGYSVTVEPSTRLEVPIGPPTQSGFSISMCPAGKVAVGIEGNSGYAVDWFALRCARPTLR